MARRADPRAIVVFRMPVEIAAQIAAHARSGYPHEVCGLLLVTIYHSRPHGPETPSPTGFAHAFYPESVYLMVSLATPDRPVIRGFRITDRRVRETGIIA
jgi:proteasome lid subunit RPN8/RPN11